MTKHDPAAPGRDIFHASAVSPGVDCVKKPRKSRGDRTRGRNLVGTQLWRRIRRAEKSLMPIPFFQHTAASRNAPDTILSPYNFALPFGPAEVTTSSPGIALPFLQTHLAAIESPASQTASVVSSGALTSQGMEAAPPSSPLQLPLSMLLQQQMALQTLHLQILIAQAARICGQSCDQDHMERAPARSGSQTLSSLISATAL
jgi:hypothetical protein